MNITISFAEESHLAALRHIELASFETLRAEGAVTGDPVAGSDDDFYRLYQEGLLFVALTPMNIPVGFAAALIIDNWLHIAEVDVHPDWQRRGIGRRLIQAVLSEGLSRDFTGVTLTTDRLAPFNAPFYASLGFNMLEGDAIQQHLKEKLTKETASGMSSVRRVAMQLTY